MTTLLVPDDDGERPATVKDVIAWIEARQCWDAIFASAPDDWYDDDPEGVEGFGLG